ncbi:hypothetical protein HMI54_001909 [Coelomomyces lativittatus]|nr:hypothetical protein HMI54_001909 [Coelomomyces lativittatus]
MIGSHIPYQSPDTHDLIDGELSILVLSIMDYHQNIPSSRYLDTAFLHFFAQLRRGYIGENAQRASRIYEALSRFNIQEQQQVMQVIVQQIFRILRLRVNRASIISKALKLFDELSIGYVSAKLLAKLDLIKSILKNPELDFLSMDFKHRTQYYSTISRVFFSEDPSFVQFTEFMTPFENRFNMLVSIRNPHEFLNTDFQKALVGFFRDLRGISYSINTKRNYLLFWDWIYPSKMQLLLKSMEAFSINSTVSNSLLKFFLEFCSNKNNRMTFDTSSVNGILLFREASQLLQIYGSRIMNYQASSPSQIYNEVYKCIVSCFGIYKNVLSGNYVNFGVFALYGDESLNNAMKMITSMILNIPQEHILAYPKLSQGYFELMEVMTQASQLQLWFDIPLNFFAYLCQSIGESSKLMNSAVPFNTIDHLATFVFTEREKIQKSITSSRTSCVVMAFQQLSNIIPYWMALLLNASIFEECAIHWSITRPLLPLILLGKEFYNQYCASLAQSQLSDRRSTVRDLLGNLLKDIDDVLSFRDFFFYGIMGKL